MSKLKLIKRIFKYIFLPKKYSISVLKHPVDIEGVYRFRYKMYCLEQGFLDPDNYSDNLEKDLYDKHSVHIIAFEKKSNDVIGVLRLILGSETILPTESEYETGGSFKNINRENLAEVSRFVVEKKYRSSFVSFDLLQFALFYSKENNITHWIGTIEEWLYNYIKKMFGEIKLTAKEKFIFNTWNYPFILPLEETELKFRKTKPIISFLFFRK